MKDIAEKERLRVEAEEKKHKEDQEKLKQQ